ncbi:MAG: protein-L-isoaspartate(D-aspartate) O-methyltransferase [Deltaproteobacteria bacterium]|nr:protein-L-isoaspartate(D-aspartate) O-methyltransferase [Deltaproteobacteria bacterium]MBW2666978.1 protein-L-isoaspartate(D-aspartate) O-methyltransferase [Deltaproteobacteria bacterium]
MLRTIPVALILLAAGISPVAPESGYAADEESREHERHTMVESQIAARGIRNPDVLEAVRTVPRHRFVPESQQESAYKDRPLPIGHGQTISQPYIVALMTELAELKAGDTVLEVGTGSGYQAAVLAQLGVKVYSIEIIEPLAEQARAALAATGYGDRVEVRTGDGYAGWPEHAPFDAVIVTAAPPMIPEPLKQQLRIGGRLVIPVGQSFQRLLRITRSETGFEEENVLPVRFVPMTGRAQRG